MLFDEWEKGTGRTSQEEYELAQELYNAMPEGFTKQKLFDLRNAMDEQDFMCLCEIISDCQRKVSEIRHDRDKNMEKATFLSDVVDTLKESGKIDCIKTYAALKAEEAKQTVLDNISSMWDDMNQ